MVQKTSRPRGRPRSYEPEAALAQALERFWESGYAATSLDDLSRATGMNRPSLYAAFGDKRALFLQAMQAYREGGRAALHGILSGEGSAREKLAAIYAMALATYRGGEDGARGCFLTGIALTEAVRDPEIRKNLAEGHRDFDAILAEFFAAARRDGEAPASLDPDGAASMASAVIHTLAVRARSGASRAELDRIAAQAIVMILGPEGDGE